MGALWLAMGAVGLCLLVVTAVHGKCTEHPNTNGDMLKFKQFIFHDTTPTKMEIMLDSNSINEKYIENIILTDIPPLNDDHVNEVTYVCKIPEQNLIYNQYITCECNLPNGCDISGKNLDVILQVEMKPVKRKTTCYNSRHYLFALKDFRVYSHVQKTLEPVTESLFQWSDTKLGDVSVSCIKDEKLDLMGQTSIICKRAGGTSESECIQTSYKKALRIEHVPQCAYPSPATNNCFPSKIIMESERKWFQIEFTAVYDKAVLDVSSTTVECSTTKKKIGEWASFTCSYISAAYVKSYKLLTFASSSSSACFSSSSIEFYDFQVSSFVILGDTIELQWTAMEELSRDSGVIKFRANITERATGDQKKKIPFTEAHVACEKGQSCYIYFIDLNKGKTYDIQVQPFKKEDGQNNVDENKLNNHNIIKLEKTVPPVQTDGDARRRLDVTSVHPSLQRGAPAVSVCFLPHEPPVHLDNFKVVLISYSGVWTSHVGGFRAVEVEAEEVSQKGDLVKREEDYYVRRTSRKGSNATATVYCSPDIPLDESWWGLDRRIRVLVMGQDEEGTRIAGASDVELPKVLPKITIDRITTMIKNEYKDKLPPTQLKLTITLEQATSNAFRLSYFSMGEQNQAVTQYTTFTTGNEEKKEAFFPIQNVDPFQPSDKETVLILTARTDDDVAEAVGRVIYKPANLATDLRRLVKAGGGAEGFGFRAVNTEVGKYFLETGTDPSHSYSCVDSPTCYHTAATGDNLEELIVCTERPTTDEPSGTVVQCDATNIVTDITQGTAPDDLVTTLTYHKDDTKSLSIKSEKGVREENSFELVPHKDDEKFFAIDFGCKAIQGSKPIHCSETLSSEVLPDSFNVFTVVSGDTLKWWEDKEFKNYEVVVQQLMADMVEVRWNSVITNGKEDKTFEVDRTGSSEIYNQLSVTCGPDSKGCKGYFIGLETSESYIISVERTDVHGNVVARETSLSESAPVPKEILLERVTKTSSGVLRIKYPKVNTREGEESVVGLGVFQTEESACSPSAFISATSSDEDGDSVTADFELPDAALEPGKNASLVLTLRGKGERDEATHVGVLHFSVPDYSSSSSVALNFIEEESVSAIRVQSSLADFFEFNHKRYDDPSDVRYFLGVDESEIVTVCKQFGQVEYCEEMTANKTNSEGVSPNMLLTRGIKDQDRVTLTLLDIGEKDPPESVELVAYVPGQSPSTIYSPAPYSCVKEEDQSCTQALEVSPFGDSFSIIVSYVRSDSVQAEVMKFTDFSLSAEQFSKETLEAQWEPRTSTSSGSTSFVVSLKEATTREEVEEVGSLTVACGQAGKNSGCKAYFPRMEAGEYTVTIKQDGLETNHVARRMTMGNVEEDLVVTQVHNEASEPDSLTLTVFFKNAPADDYRIVIVDSKGVWTSAVKMPSKGDGTVNENPKAQLEQYHPLDVDTKTFDIQDDVWVAVRTSTNQFGAADVQSLLLASLDQMGKGAIEVKWTNTSGGSYSIDKSHQVGCEKLSSSSSTGKCHFVLHEQYPDYQEATVEVTDEGAVLQKSTRGIKMQKLDGMELSTPTLRYDQHVRICFKDDQDSDSHTSYHLVLEDGDRVLQMANVEETEGVSGLKCVVTPRTMEVGALVSSWVLVARLDGGTVTRAGDTDWNTFLLSVNRHVRAAFNTEGDLHVSWHLLEEFKEDSGQYHLTVRKRGGVAFQRTFEKEQTSHTVNLGEGSYTACVKAMVKDIGSEEICSPIVVLDTSVQVPGISEPETFSSGNTSAMISWKPVEEASGYFVQWQNNSLSRRTGSSYVVPPLAKGSPALPTRARDDQKQNFVMVPAGVSTVEVDVPSVGDWNICVSAVVDDMLGEGTCNEVSLETNTDKPDSPKDLKYDKENSELCWNAARKDTEANYFVKWIPTNHPESAANHLRSKDTCIPFKEVGKWTVSVLALGESNVASEPKKIDITIEGIVIEVDQVGAHSLRVAWQESVTASEEYDYELTLQTTDEGKVFHGNFKCKSSDQDNPCSLYIMDIDEKADNLNVIVKRKGVSSQKNNVPLLKFDEVKVSYELRSSHNATVSWSPVKGAKEYNVSLFEDHTATKLIKYVFAGFPLSYQFATEDISIKGAYSTVQPCKDKSHCGARTGVNLNSVGEHDSSDFATVLGSIFGVLGVSFIALIALGTYRYQKKKAAIRESLPAVELSPRAVPSFGTEPRHQRMQEGRPVQDLPGYTMWR